MAIVPALAFKASSTIPFAHIPEQPIHAAFLFARQPFQKSSLIATLVPCGLKIAALFESALSGLFNRSALESLSGIDGGDPNNTRIDADHGLTLRIGISFVTIKCKYQTLLLRETVAVGSISHVPSMYCLW